MTLEELCGATRDFGLMVDPTLRGLVIHECAKIAGHRGQHHSLQLTGRTDGGECYWTGDDRHPAA